MDPTSRWRNGKRQYCTFPDYSTNVELQKQANSLPIESYQSKKKRKNKAEALVQEANSTFI